MAAHRRTTSTPSHPVRRRVHNAYRWIRRSRAARHLPFTAYIVITAVGMGYTLVLISRATS